MMLRSLAVVITCITFITITFAAGESIHDSDVSTTTNAVDVLVDTSTTTTRKDLQSAPPSLVSGNLTSAKKNS